MQRIILRLMTVGAMIIIFSACSKKTATSATGENAPVNQQARQPRGEQPQFSELLLQMDSNKDGKLSKAEVKGPLNNNFSQIDKDKNGFITEAEFKNTPPPPRRGRN